MKSFHSATLALLCIIVGLTVTLAGCHTVGTKAPSPAQIAQQVCPFVELDLNILQTDLSTLTADSKAVELAAKIVKIRPIVVQKCTDASLITTADLQGFAQFALPTMAQAVAYLPLTTAQKTKLTNDLMLVQVALGVIGIVEEQIKASQATGIETPGAVVR